MTLTLILDYNKKYLLSIYIYIYSIIFINNDF